jgi:hypothetical protein
MKATSVVLKVVPGNKTSLKEGCIPPGTGALGTGMAPAIESADDLRSHEVAIYYNQFDYMRSGVYKNVHMITRIQYRSPD